MDEKKYWDTYEANKQIARDIFSCITDCIDTIDFYEDNNITEKSLKLNDLYLSYNIGESYIKNIIDAFHLLKNYPSLFSLKYLAKLLINAGYLSEGYGIMQYYGMFSMHALKLQGVYDIETYKNIHAYMYDIDHYVYLLNKYDTLADYRNNVSSKYIVSDILNFNIPYSIYKNECREIFENNKYMLYLFTNRGTELIDGLLTNKIRFPNKLIKIDIRQILVDTIKLQEDSCLTVFNRGDNYFNHGNILDVLLDNNFILHAKVQGRKPYPYECSAKITDGKITYHSCTCPAHKKDPYTPCKHIVAMCFAHNQYICNKVLV